MNLLRTFLSAKFICCCWRNPWCDFLVTHTRKCNEPAKTRAIVVAEQDGFSLFSLCRLRNTTQLRSGTVGKSKWPVFIQNASGNPTCHCSYIFVPCLAFRVHVAGDLSKTIIHIVRSWRSHDFVRSGFTRAHPLESELYYAVKYC